MKSEIEMLGKDQVETRRKKSDPSPSSSMEFCIELEEENRALKDALNKKSGELEFSRTVHARTASRLSRAEGQLEESLKGQTTEEKPGKHLCFLQEHSSDVGSDDKASCAESWASALISELEHIKNEKQLGTPSHRNMTTSDINLMDDFAEMEKLAVVSADYPAGSGLVIQTSTNKTMNLDSSDTRNGNNISNRVSNVSVSIHKVVELLEGINIHSQDKGVGETSSDDKLLSYKTSENPTGYMVRVFQWKTAELSAVLQEFVRTCNDLLNGTTDLEHFAQLVASNLEWDVSSMKDAIMSRLDWDESRSESEVDSGWAYHSAERNKLSVFRQDKSYLPMISPLSINNNSCQMEANKNLSILDLEERLQPEIVKGECFRIQIQESKDIVENLDSEMDTMKQSKGDTGSQIEKHLETNHEWEKACQRISDLENELENKNQSCKRLEETCHDLKLQLKRSIFDWEITAASEKLAECQETILNLGKQLKALASPSDAALFNKVTSTPADSVISTLSTPRKNNSHRSCLLDKMLAEDNHQTEKDDQNGYSKSAVSTNGALGFSTNPNGIINHGQK
ncbi:hypothetical protein DH2020_037541 [Rehmannia glutinosa]|uniref:Filament-like plant protein 7 n=1 Tax=Rehmannia glutinosa TaxID=99300 RepID=A0ABR0V1C2_REHGL